MNCVGVRGELAERALGVLTKDALTPIDRHLAWCAACRKEASQLDGAAAMLAFSVAPAEPSPTPELEDRVVEAVQRAAGTRSGHVAPRRGRLLVAVVLAASLAVSAMGWGAVMAHRASDSNEAALLAAANQRSAVERFRDLLRSVEFSDPEGEVLLGTLEPRAHGGGGGGSALTLVSPSIQDMAIVLVSGVPQTPRLAMPFSVWLHGTRGVSLEVGRIGQFDEAGSRILVRAFDRDLGVYDRIVVRDAKGNVVMSGPVSARTSIPSPAP